jgi:ABC-type nitrate/sulfonate/bicarbonate transport system substrate-binding protein
VPSLALMWDRTKGSVGVRAISAVTNTDIYLNTRNPNIKSIRDFTDKDRIAVPSVKVSTQALFLQIAAEKEWGPGQHGKLDHLTVGLAHPDAIVAVLNPVGEITAHFATSPFHEAEMKAGLKTVTSGYEIMGGEVSNLVFITTEKFRAANPKVYAVVVAAMDEAIAWTNADKRRAAKLYMDMTKEKKLTEDDVCSHHLRAGLRFHEGAEEDLQVRRVPAPHRLAQEQARELEGPLFRRGPRPQRRLRCARLCLDGLSTARECAVSALQHHGEPVEAWLRKASTGEFWGNCDAAVATCAVRYPT